MEAPEEEKAQREVEPPRRKAQIFSGPLGQESRLGEKRPRQTSHTTVAEVTRIINQIRATRPPAEHTDDDSEEDEEAENREKQRKNGGIWRTEGMAKLAESRQLELPELARGALVPKTLTRHETVLHRMNSFCKWTGSVEDMVCRTTTSLATLVVEYLMERQKTGGLKWSTMESEAGSMMGALSRRGKDISKEPLMKDAMKSIKRKSAKQIIEWPMVFTPGEVSQMITLASGELKIFLILAFGGAMRPSDLFATSPTDTMVYKNHVALLVRGGKQSKEQPKTVHIVTGSFHSEIQWFISGKRYARAKHHFTDTKEFRKEIRDYIRETCAAASLRSFRSTTLITMGLLGVPAGVIQQLATHTSPGTTQRYLRFGVANAEAAYSQKGKAMLEILGHIEEEPGDFQFSYEGMGEEEDND